MRETSRITVDDIGYRIILSAVPTAGDALRFWGTSNFLMAGTPPKYLSKNPKVTTVDATRHPDFKRELERLMLAPYTSVVDHPDDRKAQRYDSRTCTRVGEHYVQTNEYLYVTKHYPGVTWYASIGDGKQIMAVSKGYPVAWLTPTPPVLLRD